MAIHTNPAKQLLSAVLALETRRRARRQFDEMRRSAHLARDLGLAAPGDRRARLERLPW
jgi:hypothetical protein